jgi:small GTP-binding protein
MGFRCGIVGLPNVGKSTLFNALTETQAAQAANYPFCTIEPNVGQVAVPDDRLDKLAAIAGSAKIIPTQLAFVDIAGLVKGASKGEGLGNQFLANIREVDAIVHVLRCFENDDIQHVENRVDPIADAETVETELLLSDLESLEKRVPNLVKRGQTGDKESKIAASVHSQALDLLREGKPARLTKPKDDEDSSDAEDDSPARAVRERRRRPPSAFRVALREYKKDEECFNLLSGGQPAIRLQLQQLSDHRDALIELLDGAAGLSDEAQALAQSEVGELEERISELMLEGLGGLEPGHARALASARVRELVPGLEGTISLAKKFRALRPKLEPQPQPTPYYPRLALPPGGMGRGRGLRGAPPAAGHTCFNCGRSGHFGNECPDPPTPQYQAFLASRPPFGRAPLPRDRANTQRTPPPPAAPASGAQPGRQGQ